MNAVFLKTMKGSILTLELGQDEVYLTVTRKRSEMGKVHYTNLCKNYLASKNELKGRREIKIVVRSRRILKRNVE